VGVRDIIVIGASAGGLQAKIGCAAGKTEIQHSAPPYGTEESDAQQLTLATGILISSSVNLEWGSAEETPLFFLRYSRRVPSFRRYGRLVDAFLLNCV
jgi:hypothetical protein